MPIVCPSRVPHRSLRRAGLAVMLDVHPQGLVADAAGIQRFVAAVEGAEVPVSYDVADAVAIGEGPAAGLRLLASHIASLRISGDPHTLWRHEPVGSGDIDVAVIVDGSRGAAVQGAVVDEIPIVEPRDGLVAARTGLAELGWPA